MTCAALVMLAALVVPARPSARGRLCSPTRRVVAIAPALRRFAANRGAPDRRRRESAVVVRALAAELRAGASAAMAVRAAVDESPAWAALLAPVAAAAERGASAADELARLGGVPGGQRLATAAVAWRVAERHGAPLSGLLDRLASSYDAEDAARADLEASVAGARATMSLLAVLPLGGLALGQALGAHPLSWLGGRPLGWATSTVAVALDAVGVWWTRRIVRVA